MNRAIEILEAGAQHMRDRASTYDKPDGELSIYATVEAFNAITGLNGSGKSNILDAICFVLGITNLSHVSFSRVCSWEERGRINLVPPPVFRSAPQICRSWCTRTARQASPRPP